MKNSILITIVTLICVLVLASCGTATDISNNATSANTTEPTTAVVTAMPTTQTTTITTTATTTKPTTLATTAKPHISAKKTAAKTVAHTAKKTATTTKKKVVATTAKNTEARNYSLNAGLTDTEVLWAQKQANEYIKTLKGVTLEPSADGYTISSGIPSWCITKEKLLSRLKEAIDCDYESSLEADWHEMGMYVKMDKDYNGVWAYTIMNECYG